MRSVIIVEKIRYVLSYQILFLTVFTLKSDKKMKSMRSKKKQLWRNITSEMTKQLIRVRDFSWFLFTTQIKEAPISHVIDENERVMTTKGACVRKKGWKNNLNGKMVFAFFSGLIVSERVFLFFWMAQWRHHRLSVGTITLPAGSLAEAHKV